MAISAQKRQMLEERLTLKLQQLEAANAHLNTLLEDAIEEYRFNSGEGGNQWARRRSLHQTQSLIAALEQDIEKLERKLSNSGILNMQLRRRD